MNIDDDYPEPTPSISCTRHDYAANDTLDPPSSWFGAKTKACGEWLELSTGDKVYDEDGLGFRIFYSNLPSDLAELF